MSEKPFVVKATNRRGPPKCPPNPAYPNGVEVNLASPGERFCLATLPYPAPERLVWHVTCRACGFRVGVTAAGRPDDPTGVRIPCQNRPEVQQ